MQKNIGRNPLMESGSKSETMETLVKAQTGVIPAAALIHSKLDRDEISLFMARELEYLRTVAESAQLSLLAALFDELRESLIDGAKHQTKNSDKIKKFGSA